MYLQFLTMLEGTILLDAAHIAFEITLDSHLSAAVISLCSHFSGFQKCRFIIYLSSVRQPALYNSQFYVIQKVVALQDFDIISFMMNIFPSIRKHCQYS